MFLGLFLTPSTHPPADMAPFVAMALNEIEVRKVCNRLDCNRMPKLHTHHRAAQHNHTHRLNQTCHTHDPGESNEEENAENVLKTSSK